MTLYNNIHFEKIHLYKLNIRNLIFVRKAGKQAKYSMEEIKYLYF